MNILELRHELDNGLNSEALFKECVEKAKKSQEGYNPFVTILDKYEKEDSDSLLSGIPYALKDNISTRGILTTASSNILKNYVPVYDATIYEKLKKSGVKRLIVATDNDKYGIQGYDYLRRFFDAKRFYFPNNVKDIGEMTKSMYTECKFKTLRSK